MKVERIGQALILRAGTGEWYNQPGRGRWDMGEDAADIGPARWHTEADAAIDSEGSRPSIVVIDTTEMTYLVGKDYGFLLGLSERLKTAGVKVTVIARATERRAAAMLELQKHIDLAGTVDEALRGQA